MANVVATRTTFHDWGGRTTFALFVSFLLVFAPLKLVLASSGFDRDESLRISQAAIGNELADLQFTNSNGETVYLADYSGKPLLISMIFTSCHHICPTTTKHLQQSADAAQEVLGDSSFNIISVGFDVANDSPESMRQFARSQGVAANNWQFLSATEDTVATLSKSLGFQFFASPRGFDHLNQLSVIDRDGKVYSQVYGIKYELPWLVEPLKQLVLNRPESVGHRIATLVDRVRLFCTVYDPSTGRYEIDNSLFFQIAIGLMVVASVGLYLLREAMRARRHRV